MESFTQQGKIKVGLWLLLLPALLLSNATEQRDQQIAISAGASYFLPLEVLQQIQPGDLILRQGNGVLSELIVQFLNEKRALSHIGVLVAEADGWYVVHTLAKGLADVEGTQSTPLHVFVGENVWGDLLIVRPKRGNTHLLAEKAKYYARLQVPYDTQFDLQDTTRFYCSELVAHLLQLTGFPSIEQKQQKSRKPYIGLQLFYSSDYSEVVHDRSLN